MRYILFGLFFLIGSLAFAQEEDSLLRVAKSSNDTTRVDILNKLCWNNVYSNTQKALSYGRSALELATKIDFKKGIVDANLKIGVVYDVTSNYDSALWYYNMALKVAKKMNNSKGIGSVYNNIGLIYWNVGLLQKALSHFLDAMRFFEKIEDSKYSGNASNNIGLVYYDMGMADKAMFYFGKALSFYAKAGDKIGEGAVYTNIGMVYDKLKNFDSSLYYYQKSELIKRSINDDYGLSIVLRDIGLLFVKHDKLDEGFKYTDLSLKMSEKLGERQGIIVCHLTLADIYRKKNQKSQELYHLNTGKELAESIKNYRQLAVAYKGLSSYYKLSGDYKQAYFWLTEKYRIDDTLSKRQNAQKIAEMEKRYQIEGVEKQNKILKQKSEIDNLKIRQQEQQGKVKSAIIYIVVVLSLILVVGSVVYFRKRNMQLKLQIDLDVLKALNEQRYRISLDLHDHVGAQLSYVISNLDWVVNAKNRLPQEEQQRRFVAISEVARQAIITLRETVWALNRSEITPDAFADKFKQFALKMAEFKQTIKIDFKESILSDKSLPSSIALNLFRICQEAFNNAMKHSGASEIQVAFIENEDSFEIEIHDNGKGFELEQTHLDGHYGLVNMKARAKETGASVNIHSEIGKGTKINIRYFRKL